MHLFQIRFAFELLPDSLLLSIQRSYQREDHRDSLSSSFLGQGELRYDSPILLDFLQIIDCREPAGWAIVARSPDRGREWSIGYYWSIASRPHENRLPGARSTTVHLFAGAREHATARMVIRWQEPGGVKVEWKFTDGTIDERVIARDEILAGRVDEEIRLRLPMLIPT